MEDVVVFYAFLMHSQCNYQLWGQTDELLALFRFLIPVELVIGPFVDIVTDQIIG